MYFHVFTLFIISYRCVIREERPIVFFVYLMYNTFLYDMQGKYVLIWQQLVFCMSVHDQEVYFCVILQEDIVWNFIWQISQ